MPKLCLGSAQFGSAYGITNGSGAVSSPEVARILSYAAENSITTVDTAQAYGNAEKVLGASTPSSDVFEFTSKLSPQSDLFFTLESIPQWEKTFFHTLDNLKVDYLHTFFVHDISDLSKDGSNHLRSWILSLKDRGLIKNIGISIYESADLEEVDLSMVDVVQLPYSVYDQRMLANGTLKMLRTNNIQVHARSVFLQGLLLTSPDSWPEWVPKSERDHHRAFVSAVKCSNTTLLHSSLYFAFSQPLLDYIVVGFCSLPQLEDTVSIIRSFSDELLLSLDDWSLSASSILLDPRRWPVSNH